MIEVDIGKKFKEIRLTLKLNQKQLATILGTKQSKISKIENNNVKFDILLIISEMCKLAGISVEDFLAGNIKEAIHLNSETRELVKIAQEVDTRVIKILTELLEIIVKNSH